MFSILYFIFDPKTLLFLCCRSFSGQRIGWRKAKRSPDGLYPRLRFVSLLPKSLNCLHPGKKRSIAFEFSICSHDHLERLVWSRGKVLHSRVFSVGDHVPSESLLPVRLNFRFAHVTIWSAPFGHVERRHILSTYVQVCTQLWNLRFFMFKRKLQKTASR